MVSFGFASLARRTMAAVADRVKEIVVRTLTRYNMLRFGRRLGVAVSGGADSVCLLHVLASLSPDLGLQLMVLHVNHGLRGEESEGDARFVVGLAASMDLPSAEARLEAAQLRLGNMERNARVERLRLFREWRAKFGLDAVALGHTQTDQAETLVMRLIRGSGPCGLMGIQPVTEDRRIRPLIRLSAVAVRNWLSQRHLEWREDSSNRSQDVARNRVRSLILPALSAENPQAESALARYAELAWEDEQHWAPLVREALSHAEPDAEGSMILDAGAIGTMDPPLAKRVLRAAVKSVLGEAGGLDLSHYEELYRLATIRRQGSVRLPGLTATRSYERLRLRQGVPAVRPSRAEVIPGPGEFGREWLRPPIRLASVDGREIGRSQEFSLPCRYNGGRHWLDGDRIAFPLVLRAWRPGDRYQPQGARREYSLHELFQRERVLRWERECWPVIVLGGRIVWSRRFGAAEWAAAGAGLANVIEVREV